MPSKSLVMESCKLNGMKNSGLMSAVVPLNPSAVIPTTVRIRELIFKVFPTRSGSLPVFVQYL